MSGPTGQPQNTASRRVLGKLGFTETGREEVDAVHGATLFMTKRLQETEVHP